MRVLPEAETNELYRTILDLDGLTPELNGFLFFFLSGQQSGAPGILHGLLLSEAKGQCGLRPAKASRVPGLLSLTGVKGRDGWRGAHPVMASPLVLLVLSYETCLQPTQQKQPEGGHTGTSLPSSTCDKVLC
jgi:hypothetical protein